MRAWHGAPLVHSGRGATLCKWPHQQLQSVSLGPEALTLCLSSCFAYQAHLSCITLTRDTSANSNSPCPFSQVPSASPAYFSKKLSGAGLKRNDCAALASLSLLSIRPRSLLMHLFEPLCLLPVRQPFQSFSLTRVLDIQRSNHTNQQINDRVWFPGSSNLLS